MVRFALMASLGSHPAKVTPGASPATACYADWRSAMDDAVRDPAELCRLLKLDTSLAAAAECPSGGLGLLVPRAYLTRVRPGDPTDPLLLQILPQACELVDTPGFGIDPLGEARAMVAPGLLQKYRGRSLIVATGACAVHCRY